MKQLIKYWYILVLAFILSLLAAFGLIFLRQEAWMPPEQEEASEPIKLEEGDSDSFREWRFQMNELEDLRLKFDARESELNAKEKSLELLRSQIASERAELETLRDSLEELRDQIERDFISIEAQELTNLQSLASIYSEVRPEAAVKVFEGLEDVEVVKILSLMPTESSARVLGQMGASDDQETLQRAAKITSDLRKVKQ